MTIFAISGKAGAGKDTLALLLKTQLVLKGYSVDRMTHINFAGKVKEAAQLIFGLDARHFVDQKLKKKLLPGFGKLTPRTILQKLGTDVARNIYKDIWVNNYDRILSKTYGIDFVFTTDLRFQNELEYLENVWKYSSEKITVIFIKISRGGGVLNKEESKHASENGITNDEIWNWDLDNNYDMYELNQAAAIIIQNVITFRMKKNE